MNEDTDQVTCHMVADNGGCGVECPVFMRGDCEVPEEIDVAEVFETHGKEEAKKILEQYTYFEGAIEMENNKPKFDMNEEVFIRDVSRVLKGTIISVSNHDQEKFKYVVDTEIERYDRYEKNIVPSDNKELTEISTSIEDFEVVLKRLKSMIATKFNSILEG